MSNSSKLGNQDAVCRLLSRAREFFQSGQASQAAEVCREILDKIPNHIESLRILCTLYHQQGYLDGARPLYQRLIALDPTDPYAYNGLGAIFHTVRDFSQAEYCYRKAVTYKPDFVDAYNNLGAVLQQMGHVEEASVAYGQAIALDPSHPVWELRRASLCPTVAASNDEIDHYRGKLLATLNELRGKKFKATPQELVYAGVYPSYALMYQGRDDRPVREAYARLFSPSFPAEEILQATGRKKVGFVVSRGHEGIFLRSMAGVLKHMTPGLFELVVICAADGVTDIREEISDEHIRILPMPEGIDNVVDLLRRDRFDLLYYWEIATDALNYFLPFYRLAPVQCTSWGIQVTSGIPGVDYYLSSCYIETDQADAHYTEALIRASTLLTYQYRSELPEQPAVRADFGLKDENTLYLFPQQIGKFHPDFDRVVGEILARDPQGILVILKDRWEYSADRLRDRLERNIGAVCERVIFLSRLSHQDYLCLVAVSDVLLDPPHYGGVNSSYDGFSLNKPIVTCESAFHISRYTGACYRKMGLADCIATNFDSYVEVAVRLGTDPAYRAIFCERIREASPVLFEDMEAVYEHQEIFTKLLKRAGCF